MKTALEQSYTYKVKTARIDNEEGSSIPVFGIEIWADPTNSLICTIENVFIARVKADEFVELCNRLELDPRHIYDVIEDAL